MVRSRRITLPLSAALLLGLAGLTGCGTNQAADGTVQTNNVRNTREAGEGHINTNANRGGTMANSYENMESNEALADRVAALPEVRTANVMLVGKNAYVAVSLENARGGMQAQSMGGTRPYGIGDTDNDGLSGSGRPMGGINGRTDALGRGMEAGVPGRTGTGGSTNGIRSGQTGTGTVGGTGMTQPELYTGNGGNGIFTRGNNMVDGTQMKRDIDDSMGRDAGSRGIAPYSYNATSDTDANDVTQDIKNKVADVVRQHHNGIDNVYVSANPDFVERANYYAEEFRAGRPLKGFAREFGTMVERIFPTRSGY
ncbi:YhcN/YlaJ family sporulation lipoprotein [Paenibacillus tepidiphilus]|uniref:YhcN/YlaJ family sporulation lipoprotein n=1 Tax=Paenibacillus tepidiphilus TaxID=2608683 RepID=UPI0013A555D3|nr:YhcN/YlaJ family sporulation lipoprotein [Paenibacillus tepidiphilus]